jgi:hypothetical protein
MIEGWPDWLAVKRRLQLLLRMCDSLASRFVFDFGSEKRANNGQKAKYGDRFSAERKRAQAQNGINGGIARREDPVAG